MKKRTLCLFLSLVFAWMLLIVPGASADTKSTEKIDTVTITREEYDRLLAAETEKYTEDYSKFDEIIGYIRDYFYIEPDINAMMESAVSGLLYGVGDIYTYYYNEEDWAALWEDDEGEYAGLGIQLLGNYEDYSVTITRVFKNTPAETAGLKKGDLLYRVEDLYVDAYTMQDAVNIMRGTVGESVNIEVIRSGEYIEMDIVRAIINVNRIEYTMLDNNVGYIFLYEFAGDCAEAFGNALSDLTEQGATSLVVDLRDNPGGWVDDAQAIADLFLDENLLVYAEDRYGNQEKTYTTDGCSDLPLVLLINGNSASSSEIISGALQDYGRATLVGVTSYGKGVIQYVVELSDGKTGFQFTYAQYYTPNGHAVHGVGITPDIVVEMPEGTDYAYLELGDMVNDPQLYAAWQTAVGLAAANQ